MLINKFKDSCHDEDLLGMAILTEKIEKEELNQTWHELEGDTMLVWSVALDSIPVAKLLIDRGASVHSTDWRGRAPIFHCESVAMVDFLISMGARVNVFDKIGSTPLHAVLQEGIDDVIRHFIKLGADVNAREGKRPPPLLELIDSTPTTENVQLLLSAGAIVNAQDKYGNTALHRSVHLGYPDIAKLLLENGADIDVKNDDGDMSWELARMKWKIFKSVFEPYTKWRI